MAVVETVAVSRLASISGLVAPGQTITHTIAIDQSGHTSFQLLYPAGSDLDLSITSPSAQSFDSTSVMGNADIVTVNASIGDLSSERFWLRAPEVGAWTVRVVAAAAADSVPYSVQTSIDDVAINLDASIQNPNLPAGQALALVAQLVDGSDPVVSASAIALVQFPDGGSQQVSLHDDGVAPDTQAGDGIYRGQIGTTSPGEYRVVFRASRSGVSGKPDFTREAFAVATASVSASGINGVQGCRGVDTNGNHWFDQLAIDVGVNITATEHYTLMGVLKDSNGNRHWAAAESVLTSGTAALTLSFDGEDLYNTGVNGPYTLSDLWLSETDSTDVRPLQYLSGTFQTPFFSFAAFEHAARLVLTGEGLTDGIDADGVGRLDSLRVRLGLTCDSTAAYLWSATLTDSAGAQLAMDTEAGPLTAGMNLITLEFPARPIGQRGINSRLYVRNFMIRGAGDTLTQDLAFVTDTIHADQFEGWVPTTNRLYVTGTFLYDDSLRGVNQTMPCNLVVAYDTKDKCAGCDSTALDSLAAWKIEPYNGGKFTIGPIEDRDLNDDNGPLDIEVRVYFTSNENCWDSSSPSEWFATAVDSSGQRWHYDSPLYRDVVAETLDVGVLRPTDIGTKSALHIMNTVVDKGWRFAWTNGTLGHSIAPITVVWSPGYSKDPVSGGTYYDPSTTTLYLDGRKNLTGYFPDEWDDPVIVHGYAQHLARGLGAVASLRKPTSPCSVTSPDTTAWNAGWADFYATGAEDIDPDSRGLDARYIDVGVAPSGARDTLTIDLENGCVSPPCGTGCLNSGGAGSELAVAGALWDLYDDHIDNPNGDAVGDSVWYGEFPIWQVFQDGNPTIRTTLGFESAFLQEWAPLGGDFAEHYRVQRVFLEHGVGAPSGMDQSQTPTVLRLQRNRPNPFNPQTRIGFDLPGTGKVAVRLIVFNVQGQRVRTLVDGRLSPGTHEVSWDGRDEDGRFVGSGVYFGRLEADGRHLTTKMILAR